MTADSLPSIEECTEMIRRQTEVLDCMHRIKDVINAQQQEAMKQRQSQEQRYTVSSEYEDEIIGPYDKLEGSGGFAGADAKKRRGVSKFEIRDDCSFLIVSREPPRLGVVIAAIGQRHQSGDGALMGLELYAMLVVYVRVSFLLS